jgi:urea carboxylase
LESHPDSRRDLGAGDIVLTPGPEGKRGCGTAITVVSPGLQTTVQELPGRTGYWSVGVPPSGAWDDRSFSLANLAVGNAPGTAGLEAVLSGPVLQFHRRSLICLTGAVTNASLDGRPVATGVVTNVPAGGELTIGNCGSPGMRIYLAIAGGIDVPRVLGSRATFLLGAMGGVCGRALEAGDILSLREPENATEPLDVVDLLPPLSHEWQLRVVPGPHGAPEHLTQMGVAAFFDAVWTVDHRADRTGVRLLGPRPGWARTDGGEAGLHPSNIHDSAYPVGAVMISGDIPVIVGPDGPSLGGFVVACVVISADHWSLGQLRPGDRVQFVAVTQPEASAALEERRRLLADPRGAPVPESASALPDNGFRPPALVSLPASGHRPEMTIRLAGDTHLLLEAGPPVLDLGVRLWIHLLARALADSALAGILETVEGVRSLLVKVDPARLSLDELAAALGELALAVPDPQAVTLAVREVCLPIALDHPEVHDAMARYSRSVRPDAPWCPDNIEFIRRINDLAERSDVFDILTSATYLVVGLGDVYLGAPVAVPIDPRHRLVTTKYDPPRTWTPRNAVGIGGVYLCVYGMEGPGGYQLVGRTVPIWRLPADSADEVPWLLRPFDRLKFFPVTTDELETLRGEILAGTRDLLTRPATFSLAEVAAITAAHSEEITLFTKRRAAGFAAERERWAQ